MLRWFRGRKKRGALADAPEGAAATSEEELEFLRGRADFDAEEMASVKRSGPVEDEAPAAWPELEEGSPFAAEQDPNVTQPSLRFSEMLGPQHPPAPEREPRRSAPGQLTLAVLVEGRHAVVTITDEALIGRSDPDQGIAPEVDLYPDDAVSRRHARIYRQGGQYFVQDLRSTNGTCLNGEWVVPGRDERLCSGDIILLGETSELQVLAISFGTELTTEDLVINQLLHQAMGLPGEEPTPTWEERQRELPAARDVLDLALTLGAEAGLLESGSEVDEAPAPPEWRLRDFNGLELPGLVER